MRSPSETSNYTSVVVKVDAPFQVKDLDCDFPDCQSSSNESSHKSRNSERSLNLSCTLSFCPKFWQPKEPVLSIVLLLPTKKKSFRRPLQLKPDLHSLKHESVQSFCMLLACKHMGVHVSPADVHLSPVSQNQSALGNVCISHFITSELDSLYTGRA